MFPYLPVEPSKGFAMAFAHTETGEIFEFPASWLSHLDRVESLLMQNHEGDYTVVLPKM
jgi:hypothetical protein